MGLYSRYILPHVINFACGTRPIERQRKKVAPLVEGVVLELGFGSGLNIPYLDASKIKKLYALEPAPGLPVVPRGFPRAVRVVRVLAEHLVDLEERAARVTRVPASAWPSPSNV